MISIVVCSINEDNFLQFRDSVKKTIGVEYEIIRIDNNIEKLSLCAAYNKGVQQTRFPYICFVHEDVIFHTKNWGLNLIKHLTDETVGLIGIAGSSYVPFCPSGWWIISPKDTYMNFIQAYKYTKKEKKHIRQNASENGSFVFAVDGVFLGMRRHLLEEFQFNEKVSGFHAYDLDMALRVSTKFRNKVVFDILIEHLSEGKPDADWLKNTIYVRENIKHNFNGSIDKNIEYINYIGFVYTVCLLDQNILSRWRKCIKYFSLQHFGYRNAAIAFLRMNYHVFKVKQFLGIQRNDKGELNFDLKTNND